MDSFISLFPASPIHEIQRCYIKITIFVRGSLDVDFFQINQITKEFHLGLESAEPLAG